MRHDPKTGRFIGPSQTTEERFWPKVKKTTTCWNWIGGKSTLGYGGFWNGAKVVQAHRYAYELLVGGIPKNITLDHLCRNPSCVNPDHLDPVTHKENVQRGEAGIKSGIQQSSKTHCPQGHLYNKENTYITPSTGARNCRTCRTVWGRASRKRKG